MQSTKLKRLTFARDHQTWNSEWKNIVWSDDKKWNLDGPDYCASVWHDDWKKKAVLLKRNTGGRSLMVWGAFSYNGKSNLTTISTCQDSAEYQRHLKETLLSVWKKLSKKDGLFMHDSARCHVSHDSKAWLAKQNIKAMD